MFFWDAGDARGGRYVEVAHVLLLRGGVWIHIVWLGQRGSDFQEEIDRRRRLLTRRMYLQCVRCDF